MTIASLLVNQLKNLVKKPVHVVMTVLTVVSIAIMPFALMLVLIRQQQQKQQQPQQPISLPKQHLPICLAILS